MENVCMKERWKVVMWDWILKKVKKENENVGFCKNNILFKKDIMIFRCFNFIKCVIIDILIYNIFLWEYLNLICLKCS